MIEAMDTQRMRRLRRLATVPRWTIVPTLQRQNVAEHSYHVACIALWLTQWHGNADIRAGLANRDIMYFAMIHDETEALTGDVPSPAGIDCLPGKSAIYEVAQGQGAHGAGTYVKQLLKLADLLEAWWFLLDEIAMGNGRVAVIQADISNKLALVLSEFPFKDIHWTAVLSEFKKMALSTEHPRFEKTK